MDIAERIELIQSDVSSFPQVLKSELMIMDQRIADALTRVQTAITDAVTKEVGEVKALIQAGADPTEVVTALDNLATNITASVDKISDDAQATENPSTGEAGSGSSSGGTEG